MTYLYFRVSKNCMMYDDAEDVDSSCSIKTEKWSGLKTIEKQQNLTPKFPNEVELRFASQIDNSRERLKCNMDIPKTHFDDTPRENLAINSEGTENETISIESQLNQNIGNGQIHHLFRQILCIDCC